MATPILMPQLGLTMTEGLLMEWREKAGDPVKKGEILFLVENDKSVIEVEAQTDGILATILAAEGETVPVGRTVGIITAAGEKIASASSAEPEAPEQQPKEVPTKPAATPGEVPPRPACAPSPGGFVLASPLARRLAEERGIDLKNLSGSGPEGAVVERDLSGGAAPAKEAPSSSWDTVTLSRVRTIGAERMIRSWTEIPQFTLYGEARGGKLLELQAALKNKGIPLSLTVILAKLLAGALLRYPLLNASWLGGGRVKVFKTVNVGIAMDTPEGLVVPVLRDCASKGLGSLAEEMKALAEKGKAGTLTAEDFQEGTATLSNLGMFGVKRFRAIVNPPQTAILAVGAIDKKPVEKEDRIVFEDFIEFGLTADHRAVDGAYAARFLALYREFVEDPLQALV